MQQIRIIVFVTLHIWNSMWNSADSYWVADYSTGLVGLRLRPVRPGWNRGS